MAEKKECIYPDMKLHSCPFMQLGRICNLVDLTKCPAEQPEPTPDLTEEQVIERLAARLYALTSSIPFKYISWETKARWHNHAKNIYAYFCSLGYERMDKTATQGQTEQHIDDVIGSCVYQINNNLATTPSIVRQIRDAFKASGYRSPSEIRELCAHCDTPLLKEGESIRVLERAAMERVFGDLEEMGLVSRRHSGHKRGEVMLVSCARCTYEEYKRKKLSESELLGEQGK